MPVSNFKNILRLNLNLEAKLEFGNSPSNYGHLRSAHCMHVLFRRRFSKDASLASRFKLNLEIFLKFETGTILLEKTRNDLVIYVL